MIDALPIQESYQDVEDDAPLEELARDSLLAYACFQNPSYEIPEHIAKIAKILERVESGELKRVIVTIPPRHGKSMMCSQYFPAWFLGRNPTKFIITATYGQDLSDDFGRSVRDQMESAEYRAVFPGSNLRGDTRAVSRMSTYEGGTYFGVGAGGPITGRGAHVFLIDDPIKNREEADSATHRHKLEEWYRSVAYSRLMPDAAIIVIMTRWHPEDIVNQLLTEHSHENWVKVDLPALDEDTGKALWPERYDLEALERIRKTQKEYNWHCLYQQNPIPRDGVVFKDEYLFSGYESEYALKFIGIDTAISQEKNADETSITVCGIPYGEKVIYDEIETQHGQWSWDEIITRIKGLSALHKPLRIGVEGDREGKIVKQVLKKEGINVKELPPIGDKVLRARSIEHLFEQRRVRINTPKLRSQLLTFRGEGEKNDCVDSLVHCLRMAVSMANPKGYLRKTLQPLTYDNRVLAWQEKRKRDHAKRNRRGVAGADSVLGGVW